MESKPALFKQKISRLKPWVWLGLAIAYTLSPIDLVPDVFPFLGWLDDISLLSAAILNLLQHYSSDKHANYYLLTIKYLKWLCLLFALILIVFLGILAYLIFS